jgi:transposase
MIILELTEKQLDELYDEMLSNTSSLARKKCLIIYLRAKGYSRCEIADIARVDEDTVTNHVKIFAGSGLQGLLKANYYKPKSQLEPYVEELKKLFEKNPPHTVNHAIELIFEQTGVCLKHSACQAFLKKMGMKCRRCGLVPGKANDDKEQQKAQQEFHDQKLQPRLDEAKQGKRTVLFVDAAHFVMGAFLGMVWCFTRLLLPSASGRKRHNVLGAYDPITNEAITVTNDTYINQWVFGEFLDKIADAYAGTNRPITLVLDNARYQKCQSVADKAKELGIELLYLPAYSPNLNLIERLWRFVKKQVLYSIHYDKFEKFKKSIDTCIAELSTRFKANMQTLMTMKFQLFSEKAENLTV